MDYLIRMVNLRLNLQQYSYGYYEIEELGYFAIPGDFDNDDIITPEDVDFMYDLADDQQKKGSLFHMFNLNKLDVNDDGFLDVWDMWALEDLAGV